MIVSDNTGDRTTGYGSGITLYGGDHILKDVVIRNNTGALYGGGLTFLHNPITSNTLTYSNVTFSENDAQTGQSYFIWSGVTVREMGNSAIELTESANSNASSFEF